MGHESHFLLDGSLERAICDERLDGRSSLVDDLRRGFHAKAVIGELERRRTAQRSAAVVVDGDLELREVARGSEAAFQWHVAQHGLEAFGEDGDLLEWQMRRDPSMRTRYEPRKTCVFIGSKYGPARA